MLLRNLYTTSNLLSRGEWQKSGGISLYGKTVGIIGAGHIGAELIRLLQPFGCNILINDILDKSSLTAEYSNVKQVPLDSLLNQSDIVSLHVPLTIETEQLVDTDFLAKMKPTAVLLNTARGELVDQHALKTSLLNAQIAGAAIDVYDEEPPTDLELLSIPNLIPTPHIGGNSMEATLAMGKAAIHNLSDL
jgi:D-3-phosphoglycerate dehydrogenase